MGTANRIDSVAMKVSAHSAPPATAAKPSTGISVSSAVVWFHLIWRESQTGKARTRMARRMPTFLKYLIVGVFNTAIHVAVFAVMQLEGNDQALSNLVAFIVALSFSFIANARFTFRAPVSLMRYCVFVAGMGSLSASLGYFADSQRWPPPLTVGVFSLISLLLGFMFSRWVFMEKRRWIFR